MNNTLKTGSYTETIFRVVFGVSNPFDALSEAERLCDKLIEVRVPMDQQSTLKKYVKGAVNRKDCDKSFVWTLAQLLRTDQRHITSVDTNLIKRLEKRDLRIADTVNGDRRYNKFDNTARWVLGELVRHVATSTQGLRDVLKAKKFDTATIQSVVREFSKQRFSEVITRIVSVANEGEQKWITPSILTEQLLSGVLGGGDWYKDEVKRPILLWKEHKKPLRKFHIRCNKKFIDHFAPKIWTTEAFYKVGRPRSKAEGAWVEFEFMDWLGSAWVEANMVDGFWKDNSRQLCFAIEALENGGAFILGNDRPSARGKKYINGFVASLQNIRYQANSRVNGADFRLWFDWDWQKELEPFRTQYIQDCEQGIDQIEIADYEAKLGEAYEYRCELAKLLHSGDEQTVNAYIGTLERKKIPPDLILDWLKHPILATQP